VLWASEALRHVVILVILALMGHSVGPQRIFIVTYQSKVFNVSMRFNFLATVLLSCIRIVAHCFLNSSYFSFLVRVALQRMRYRTLGKSLNIVVRRLIKGRRCGARNISPVNRHSED